MGSGVATGDARGGRVPPLTAKKMPKIGEKSGIKRRNREEKANIGKVFSLCPSWQIGLATLLHMGSLSDIKNLGVLDLGVVKAWAENLIALATLWKPTKRRDRLQKCVLNNGPSSCPEPSRLQASLTPHAPPGDFRRQTFLETLYIDLLKSGCLQKSSPWVTRWGRFFQNGLQNTIYNLITIQIVYFLAHLIDISSFTCTDVTYRLVKW